MFDVHFLSSRHFPVYTRLGFYHIRPDMATRNDGRSEVWPKMWRKRLRGAGGDQKKRGNRSMALAGYLVMVYAVFNGEVMAGL